MRATADRTVDPDETFERNHELRTSLCGLEAAAVALREARDRMPGGDVDALADAIVSEARRLRLMLTPSERRDSVFDLSDAIRPAIVMVRSLGVVVNDHVSDAIWVHGSRDDVAQVVLALLDNARVHAAPSPVDIRVTLASDTATLYVEDRGPGIGTTDAHRIFSRGRRSPSSSGSGLGLFIARRLAARQGGSLGAAARPGGGASFALSLRRAQPNHSHDAPGGGRRSELVP